MQEYKTLVRDVLTQGTHKPNRTALDTVSDFGYHYKLNLEEGTLPVVTTKKFFWNSFIHEFFWYLSGESHVRTLQEETGIWDEWANDQGQVDTSYARFWRRYPLNNHTAEGAVWANQDNAESWVNEEEQTFDQIQYIIDMLKNNPHSRRIVLNAWHPANAAVSTLPPCHYTAVFNVQGDGTLNCHMTQRSGDIALGIPFNIAAYSLLTHLLANETGFEVGEFSHEIVDAHIYCGDGDRGDWYADNLSEVQHALSNNSETEARELIQDNAPEPDSENGDHVPGLLDLLTRDPYQRPTLEFPEEKSILDMAPEDIVLSNYSHHDPLRFAVAE
jgi:thymidylate synthase